jgi:hypothetical protein
VDDGSIGAEGKSAEPGGVGAKLRWRSLKSGRGRESVLERDDIACRHRQLREPGVGLWGIVFSVAERGKQGPCSDEQSGDEERGRAFLHESWTLH